MFCKNCGCKLNDDVMFCPNCGTKVDQQINNNVNNESSIDSNINNEKEFSFNIEESDTANVLVDRIEDNNIYSNSSISANTTNEVKSDNDNQVLDLSDFNTKSKKRGFNKLWLKIGIPAICVVLVAVFALFNPFFGILINKNNKSIENSPKHKNAEYFLYSKDNNIACINVNDLKPIQITSNLLDDLGDDIDFNYFNYNDNYNDISDVATFNDEGNLLFYYDNMTKYGSSLYCRDLSVSDETKAIQKIDSDVVRFEITDDGKNVFYMKSGDYNLYYNDLKDKAKLASSVKNFCITSDGKRLIYKTSENDIHFITNFKDDELIDRDVEVAKTAKDLSKIYYIKDGSLFLKEINKDKVKLATDVSSVLNVFDNGTIYYITEKKEKISYNKYINKDVDIDSYVNPETLTSPDWEEYYYSYDDYDSAEEAYEKAYESYQKKYQENEELEDAYELYSALDGEYFEYNNYSLCYYDGKENKSLNTDYFSYVKCQNGIVIYSCYNRSKDEKVNLSDIQNSSASDVEDDIESNFYDSSSEKLNYYIAVNGTNYDSDTKEYVSTTFIDDKNVFYYISDFSEYSENPNGTLYKRTITDGKLDNAVKLYDDVAYFGFFGQNNDLYTLRSIGKSTYYGDLYCNDNKIDFDVSYYSIKESIDNNYVCYLSSVSKEGVGTLNIYDGKNKTKLSDDVAQSIVFTNKKSFIISDYSTERNKGTLYYYNNGKKEIADQDDVQSICELPSNSERRENNISDLENIYGEVEQNDDESDSSDYDNYDDYD